MSFLKRKLAHNLRSFQNWKTGYKFLTLLVVLISIPVTVLLLRDFVLFLSRAADVTIFFQPSTENLTTSTNKQVSLMIDANVEQVGAGQIEFNFDNTKVQLASEITPNPMFTQVIQVTTMTQANSTGRATIVLGTGPGAPPATGTFEFAKITFRTITTQSLSTQVTINATNVQIVNLNAQALGFTANPLTLNLNPTTPTTLPTPTSTRTPTPTTIPSVTQQPSQRTTLNPLADAFVYNQDPDGNYNTGVLGVDGSPVKASFLKFDLSSLAGKAVLNATLRLKTLIDTTSASSATQYVKQVSSNSWSESTLTWTNQPASGSTVGTMSGIPSNTYIDTDVTSYTQSKVGQQISFAIDQGGGDGTDFYSKETSFKPELVVTYAGAPVTTTTPVPTVTGPLPTITGQTGTPDTTLSLSTGNTRIPLNQSFSVAVNINSGTNQLIGVELNVRFDPAILKADDITAGNYFSNVEVTGKTIDNNTGRVSLTLLLPPGSTPRQGTGNLANIAFTAMNRGTTSVSFYSSTLVAAVNSGSRNMLRSTTPLSLDVVPNAMPGDIDGDGDVDILDYVILFENFGRNVSDPAADARADLTRDGRIDILDYVILFENFGRTA